jgi:hypothetical protein
MRFILSATLLLAGCAGVPPGALHWNAVPPAPAATTDYFLKKGTAPVGRVAVIRNGTFDAYGCPSGQLIGNFPTLDAAQSAVLKACKL